MTGFLNVVRFTPTAGGTTDWTYSAAVTGYQSPTAGGVVNGTIYRYRAESADLSQWEIGYGAYNTGTGVLARTTVLFNSSGTTSKINFSAAPQVSIVALAEDLPRVQSIIPCGRLTLTSGTPVPTSDVTAATSFYYTPFNGNVISLYDGSNWVPITFTEVTVSISGFTANSNYDVWGRISSGALAIDTTIWTNDTTRATAITTQDGIDVKSGDTTRRLLGTIRITGTTGQTEDSRAKRYISNRYNDVPRSMLVTDSTATWTYTGASWRQANANTANQLDYVTCVDREVSAVVLGIAYIATAPSPAVATTVGVGIGLDTVPSATQATISIGASMSTQATASHAYYRGSPGVGRHKLIWIEYGPAAGSTFITNGGVAGWQGTVLPWNIAGISGLVSN